MPKLKRKPPIEITLGGETYRLRSGLNLSVEMVNRGIDPGAMAAVLTDPQTKKENHVAVIKRLLALAIYCSYPQDEPWGEEYVEAVSDWVGLDKIGEAAEVVSKLFSSEPQFEGQLAPFVPTPIAAVERALDLAGLKAGELLVDLGAGDGRVLRAAEKRGAEIRGYEKHLGRLAKLCADFGEPERDCRRIYGMDIREADLLNADVVFVYLLTTSNAELKSKLLAEMKPGARLVSHDFDGMGADWRPEITERVQCEDRAHTIYVWKVPERAARSETAAA